MKVHKDLVRDVAILLLLLLILLIFTGICVMREETSPVTGTVTDMKHYPASMPIYPWTSWHYELIVTSDDGRQGYSVAVSESVYEKVAVGDRVQRHQPYFGKEVVK